MADIADLVNRAADDVLEAIDAPDEGVRDAINLLVNVVGERLKNPDASVEDVIRASYDKEPEEVLGWCRS
jgi:hypothetical protein